MKKLFISTVSGVVLAAAMSASASTPTSITFHSEATAPDGTPYANYVVTCANGKQQPLTAWDDRREWCVGAQSREDCHRKQIKAAKIACKL